MTLQEAQEAFQAYLEMVRTNPESEELVALRREAARALEVAWLNRSFDAQDAEHS